MFFGKPEPPFLMGTSSFESVLPVVPRAKAVFGKVKVLGTLKKAIRLIQSKAFVLSFLLTIKILGLASGTLHPLEIALLPISGSACVGTLINDWRSLK